MVLEKRFVVQPEMAKLHKKCGIFLCPTRWGSQDVSRGEAMSSGVLACTTNTAVIAEFADVKSSVLTEHESSKGFLRKISHVIEMRNAVKFEVAIPRVLGMFS